MDGRKEGRRGAKEGRTLRKEGRELRTEEQKEGDGWVKGKKKRGVTVRRKAGGEAMREEGRDEGRPAGKNWG
jgi:hypothetical protein